MQGKYRLMADTQKALGREDILKDKIKSCVSEETDKYFFFRFETWNLSLC